MFDPASHRDFLGAVLNTGLDRKKIGDIVMQVNGPRHRAHVLFMRKWNENVSVSNVSIFLWENRLSFT